MPHANYTLRMSFGKYRLTAHQMEFSLVMLLTLKGILEKVNTQQDAYKIDEKFKKHLLKTKRKIQKTIYLKYHLCSFVMPGRKMVVPFFYADEN